MGQKGPKLQLTQSYRNKLKGRVSAPHKDQAEGPVQRSMYKDALNHAKQQARTSSGKGGVVMPSGVQYRRSETGEGRLNNGERFTTKGRRKRRG